jgi:hypothetical protein
MKQAIAIPFNRFMELAVQAGHMNDMPFGSKQNICLSQQLEYIKFAHAIAVELQTIEFDKMDISHVLEIATREANFREIDLDALDGKAMMEAAFNNNQLGLFFFRFAKRIADELDS